MDLFNRAVAKVKRTYHRARYFPRVPVTREVKTLRLGSEYGGWNFIDHPNLWNSTVINCGVGEDASFDVEFASRYGARMILVDPTPRAVQHVGEILSGLGREKKKDYLAGGKQPIEAYELSKLTAGQLKLYPFALWNKKEKLKFYVPKDPRHVSHSILNYQNEYRRDTDYIFVETTTLDELMALEKMEKVGLLKLDIEGAEIEVLRYMMEKKIFPDQILVEFDELNELSKKGMDRIQSAHDLLLENEYECVFFDGLANFIFSRLKA